MDRLLPILSSHVIDILASTKGRDQPIMRIEKAMELVSCFENDTFLDPNIIFFDPFCKGGEIILAVAVKTCLLNHVNSIKDIRIDQISKELYRGRFFALAPDERHHLLSKRTFYGNDRSHSKEITHHIQRGDYLSELDGRLDKKKFENEFLKMLEFIKKHKHDAKIIAVGNPPYQESDFGYGKSAKPIYQYFVETLIESGQIYQFCVVIPARWFACGKGLEKFRQRMIDCKQLKTIRYFEQAEELFPTVQIKGGVCFLQWKSDHALGTKIIFDSGELTLDGSKYDIIPDDPFSLQIVDKIKKWDGLWVSDTAWSRKPFGLETDYFKKNKETTSTKTIPCLTKARTFRPAPISAITKNADKIDFYKIICPRAYGKGMKRCTLPVSQIFILDKGKITTETYNVIGCFPTRIEAEHFKFYLQSYFARYLLGLRKTTQDIPKERWSWVPFMDVSVEWTDEKLFDYFRLSEKERKHIKKKVEEWS